MKLFAPGYLVLAIALFLAADTLRAREPGGSEPATGESTDSSDEDFELQAELLRRKKTDQEARGAYLKWFNERGTSKASGKKGLSKEDSKSVDRLAAVVKKVDRENTRWFKGVIAKRGWPTQSMVGLPGARAAWVIVQHADDDPKFQRQCLNAMAQLPKEEFSQADFAELTDRVLLAEGKKQRYGTQVHTVDGKSQLHPLQDEAKVDTLRAEVGLPPLDEYVKQLEKTDRRKVR